MKRGILKMKREILKKKIVVTFVDDNNVVKQKVFDAYADVQKFLEDNSYHIYTGGGYVYGPRGEYTLPQPIGYKHDNYGVKTKVYFLTV